LKNSFREITYSVFQDFPHILCCTLWQEQNFGIKAGETNDESLLMQDLVNKCTFSAHQLVLAKQVHGNHIVRVSDAGVVDSCDGLLTRAKELPLIIRTADCAAVMLYSPSEDTIVNLHVGWRGAAAGIIGEALKILTKSYTLSRKEIWVAVGPLIRACCYQVGPEFTQIFGEKYLEKRASSLYFSLQDVIEDQLREAGILQNHLEFSGECTFCSPLRFPSFRRDNTRHRIMNIIKKKEVVA